MHPQPIKIVRLGNDTYQTTVNISVRPSKDLAREELRERKGGTRTVFHCELQHMITEPIE